MISSRQYSSVVISIFLLIASVEAQVSPTDGLHRNTPRVFALTGATVFTEPGKVLPKATIIIRDGLIEAVGTKVRVPSDAVKIDLSGKTVYAGFIESAWAAKAPQNEVTHTDNHWNTRVRPSRSVLDGPAISSAEIQKLHSLGFTVAHLIPSAGIYRGSSAIVQLSDTGSAPPLKTSVAQSLAFELSVWPEAHYPRSLMGAIALMRQTFLDAQWYGNSWEIYQKNRQLNEPPEVDRDLQSLFSSITSKQPFLIETTNDLSSLQAVKIAKEFNLPLWLIGNGFEYRHIPEIKARSQFIILPLNFPNAPFVTSQEDALQVSLAELRHWDQAPDNPQRLANAGVAFSISSSKLQDISTFRANIVRSVQRGLESKIALAALTTVPAKYLGLGSTHGKIAKGFSADLVVSSDDYFTEDAKVEAVWVSGKKFDIAGIPENDFRGDWDVDLSEKIGQANEPKLKITGKIHSPTGKLVIADSQSVSLSNLSFFGDNVQWTVRSDTASTAGLWRFSGNILAANLVGTGITSEGSIFTWTASRTSSFNEKNESTSTEDSEKKSTLLPLSPEGAFGRKSPPKKEPYILIKNATIWTMGPKGNIVGDLLIEDGKVAAVAKKISRPSKSRGKILEIDGTGKHITPGLIDAHSHSALRMWNEWTEAISAEVRVSDVIDNSHIELYRQLAGGLTIANVLHGSSNPIGGQNAVIKLRWGALPSELIEQRAPQGIKFALGENAKRSNWGANYIPRYPRTRMGVDQIIRDALQTAKEYDAGQTQYKKSKKLQKTTLPPRRDLELDALVEILKGKRLVHAHSYRQDEILNLIQIADDFGFTIATFTHVLEGYKVAPEIAKHGAGGSTFADFWGYKHEVVDAISYNGALMTKAGVLASFNSDDGELARHLNTEAAKAVRYGGLSEIEALKMVTINPAKQLKIDSFAGSLEKGKDGDFVLWSGHPLSTFTLAEQTWIEGQRYFSLEDDKAFRIQIKQERAELIQKVLSMEGGK